MERINRILASSKYIEYLKKNDEAEKTRVFCHHDLRHAIDVARVAYILSLEEQIPISKDMIYAASLLHDIGRWKEYLDGSDHAVISADLALGILENSGFKSKEQKYIYDAIKNHRTTDGQSTALDRILYTSDKISRPCHTCHAIEACKRFEDGKKPKLSY
ncbi:HD domain-containing protein [Clostridiaceae bacterium 35-E11]